MIEKRNNRIAFFVTFLVLSSSLFVSTSCFGYTPTIATLTFKVSGGGVRPDYGLHVAQYLAEIGIKVNVKVEEWIIFIGTLTTTYDFDLAFLGLTGGGANPHPTGVYNENGSLNMFGINTDMPYGQENEDMINEGIVIMDLEERQQHYYDWQQLLMDKILPLLPFYSPQSYVATWSNLQGYDYRWDVVDSLPYMEFDGLHTGQESTKEFVDSDAKWKDLNPLTRLGSRSYICDLIMEPILQMTPGFEPIKSGLIVDWEQDETNEYVYKFTMRDEVYWNPSYNITERTAESAPLDPATTPLMVGLQGEYSNGTNQQVTAKDTVFTLLAWAKNAMSEEPEGFRWMKDIWIDDADELVFYIEIDGDPDTPENEPYASFWPALTYRCLPEFFLNSTNTTLMTSSGGVPYIGLYDDIHQTDQWKTFSTSAFGCGKYMLDYCVPESITILRKSPYWMGIGAIDGTQQDLDIETIKIRVIPDLIVALDEFKAGKLDIMGVTIFPDERSVMENNPDFSVYNRLQSSINFFGFNLRRPFIGGEDNYVFLTKPGYEDYTKACAVRKAICYAIDREEINNVLHDGEFITSHSPIYPIQEYWYYEDIVKYEFNLETAKLWLMMAGYIEESSTEVGYISTLLSLLLLCYTCIFLRLRTKKRKRYL